MAIEGGIFSSARKAWIAVAVYTVFLYATLTIAYDIFMFYSNRISPDSVLSYMNLAFVPVGVILLLFVVFSLPRVWGVYLSFTLICLGVAFSLQILTIPAKRFHFFQYAPLTVLVFDALRFTVRGRFLATDRSSFSLRRFSGIKSTVPCLMIAICSSTDIMVNPLSREAEPPLTRGV